MAVRSRDPDEMTRWPRAEPRETARDILSPADDLVLADEHIFPGLRVPQLDGETSLEHMLRQIDALMQGQGPRLLPPPASDNPSGRATRQTALPRKPVPPRSEPLPARSSGKAVVFGAAGARLALGFAVAVAVLFPPNAGLFPSWPSIGTGRLASWVRSGESADIIAVAPIRHPRVVAPAVFAPVPPPATASPQAAVTRAPAPADSRESPSIVGEDALRPPAPPILPSLEPAAGQRPMPEPVPKFAAGAIVPDRPAPAITSAPPLVEARSTERTAEIPVALLLERGNRLLAAGDIASARQFFGRAVEAGSPAAALAMARTYDPHFLRLINPVGMGADTARAMAWYRQAAKAGDAEAARRLQSLEREAVPKFPADARLSDLRR